MEKPEGLRVYRDTDELARAAARLLLNLSSEKIKEKGSFTVVLSGGKTPETLYRLLASPEFKESIEWTKVRIFWGDERCVPPDDPESNYGMASRALLSKVPVPPENLHRIKGELGPSLASALYEEEITAYFKDSAPVFDLVLLGLGEDGHTLSLFPGTEALDERKRLVAGNFVGKLGSWRVTMTLQLVNRASNLVFIAAGAGKSRALKEALEGRDNPAGKIRPVNGRLLWLADMDAAKPLKGF
ncbi:MAG: 6-phosphogluconolactonase [Deltaproteobacteria bacterium]|nr:6-phosphogluconolactonase [Deltaproteobacteria bacterium]